MFFYLKFNYCFLFEIKLIINPAHSEKFCDCIITFPGPTNLVKNNPSPPKNIFPNPFIVSISYETVFSNPTEHP